MNSDHGRLCHCEEASLTKQSRGGRDYVACNEIASCLAVTPKVLEEAAQ